MAKLLNLFTAIKATGATPEGDGDGGFLADLTNLRVRPARPEGAKKNETDNQDAETAGSLDNSRRE